MMGLLLSFGIDVSVYSVEACQSKEHTSSVTFMDRLHDQDTEISRPKTRKVTSFFHRAADVLTVIVIFDDT